MSNDASLERGGVFDQPLPFSCFEELIDGARDCAILLSNEIPAPVDIELGVLSGVSSSCASAP